MAEKNLRILGFKVGSRSRVTMGPRGTTVTIQMDGHDGSPDRLGRQPRWYDVEGFDSEARFKPALAEAVFFWRFSCPDRGRVLLLAA